MELVTMPLSQRTRSSPVMRIQPVDWREEIPAPWSSARSCDSADSAGEMWGSDWIAGVIAGDRALVMAGCERTTRKSLRTLDYSGGLRGSSCSEGLAVKEWLWGFGWRRLCF